MSTSEQIREFKDNIFNDIDTRENYGKVHDIIMGDIRGSEKFKTRFTICIIGHKLFDTLSLIDSWQDLLDDRVYSELELASEFIDVAFRSNQPDGSQIVRLCYDKAEKNLINHFNKLGDKDKAYSVKIVANMSIYRALEMLQEIAGLPSTRKDIEIKYSGIGKLL